MTVGIQGRRPGAGVGGEMTSYTIKALLMIAMFGLFEAALNFPTLRRLRKPLARLAANLRHGLALQPHAQQPARVKAKHREG
jgi:hypothetical protein